MTNKEMLNNIEILSQFGDRTEKFGYAVARNMRKLKECATEFLEMRQTVFAEYGTQKEDGRIELPISVYKEKLGDIEQIEHEVDIYQVDEEIFLSAGLNSAQMEALLWMVKGE